MSNENTDVRIDNDPKQGEYFIIELDKLVPYANNARTHSKAQIDQIAASIRAFGYMTPITIDENNTILSGHGRYYALQKLGIKKIPCMRVSHLTENEKKAYIIADNKIALNAEWDEDMLKVDIADLEAADFDMDLLGFSEKEMKSMFGEAETGEDDSFDVDAELEKPCFSKTGDIWHLGKHTVICGDSTLPETFKALLGDVKVNLVCTDAPYFVNLESASGKIRNDDLNDEEAYKFLMAVFSNVHEAMAKDASIYEFYATSKSRIFHDAFEDAGFKVGAGLVWKKDRLVLTRTDWKYIHEPIIWGWRKDGKHVWYGDQKQTTVFEFPRIKNSKDDGFGHASSKPVPLIAYLIQQCTQTNSLVLDCFLGSASTLIACEQLGRVCYGVEIEPKFVDVAVKRYIQQVGDANDGIFVERGGAKIPYTKIMEEFSAREDADE